ncbi:Rep [uncultured virus]|uniref:Rep n=1 Tax=uncultured virus TaxID=340016 RepID=A0A2K9LS22_9VIRU|nr:Rep [uncultured virus]
MEDRKYKYWVFTWNEDLDSERLLELEAFLKTFCDSYVFQKEKGETTGRLHLQGFLQLKVRKRHPTLLSLFKMKFENINQLTIERMMGTKEEAIAYCTKTDTRISRPRYYGFPTPYEASDLQIFNNSVNWYPWQKSFMELIFNKDLTIKEPDDRTIIWIQDLMGNSGKSKLVKHVCFNYPEESCKLSFGSSTQLRSACITAGPKKLYFIDVPRTLGKDDDINDLISVIEDIKNGFVVSSMYGKHQQMMFDPPHIVVFANVFCPQNALSSDRLRQFTLDHEIGINSKILNEV